MIFDIERHARTKLEHQIVAPGQPGREPRWSTGAKTAVGTAVSSESRVWFTISHGILNEVYFPSIDQANTRAMRFLVAGADRFLSDEEWDAKHSVSALEAAIPAFRIDTECKRGRYRIRKEIVTDPDRDVLLMNVEFEAAGGSEDLRLYCVVDPHVGDRGADNEAWVGQYKGIPMLFAKRDSSCLTLACSSGFEKMSCGFDGASDTYTDLQQHGEMTWQYTHAPSGNVILGGQIGWKGSNGKFVLAFAFGGHGAEAGQQARAGLSNDFADIRRRYVRAWRDAQRRYFNLGSRKNRTRDMYRVSTAVLRIHGSKRFPGAIVAGLSVPWGMARGDNDIGGYHVIWPRDMAQAAMGQLACGDADAARQTLFYLQCTQDKDGRWPQNMWLDGTPHWTATQMDGTSFGILLADALHRARELKGSDPWPMIRSAAGFLARNGPLTEQERWEENAGYAPNTMAVEVAALLAAADFAERRKESQIAGFLRSTSDAWNDAIDELTYASGTEFARRYGVDGYYVRIAPPEVIRTGLRPDTMLQIKNQPPEKAMKRAVDVLAPGTLALVRFGLRPANDPRILNTVKVIDATLKREVSTGPIWYRYTNDGYGEQANGEPFVKIGIGRGWPLLAGERAHYEIARGNFAFAEKLRDAMIAQSSEWGLIPEQVWDSDDIPEHDLYNGHPSGSGMPLAWAHAEYIKLLRSLRMRRVWDTPPQTVERYQRQRKTASFRIWTFTQQRSTIPAGQSLRVDARSPARVRWTRNHWQTVQEADTVDSGLGVHYAMLNVAGLRSGSKIEFTFYWPEARKFEGRNYMVEVR